MLGLLRLSEKSAPASYRASPCSPSRSQHLTFSGLECPVLESCFRRGSRLGDSRILPLVLYRGGQTQTSECLSWHALCVRTCVSRRPLLKHALHSRSCAAGLTYLTPGYLGGGTVPVPVYQGGKPRFRERRSRAQGPRASEWYRRTHTQVCVPAKLEGPRQTQPWGSGCESRSLRC